MKQLALNLTAISPLAIRSDHAPGGAESTSYISGTTLTGSLATVYRLYHPDDTEHFQQLFLNGEVHYPNLYPATFNNKEIQNASDFPVYPLPKTAQTCKRFPGFRHIIDDEEVDDERHGVRDSLLDWAMFALGSKAGKPIDNAVLLTPLYKHKECPHCHKPMDHINGYYRRSKDGYMMLASVDRRLQTHTGINRDTGTVQEGILYNRQVFGEHMRFWGGVKLPGHLTSAFEQFIAEIGQTGLVRVGTGRTRGLGKVHLDVAPLKDEQFNSFKYRLMKFDDMLRGQSKASDFKPDLAPFYFTLTLHAPVILCDDLLRYRGAINNEVLAKLLGLPDYNFEMLYQSASVRRVTSWNELWGTPRMNEYAIDTGSVFLFAFTAKPEDVLLEALFKLEEEGIGRRTAEGFGRVCISDPFHLEVTLQ